MSTRRSVTWMTFDELVDELRSSPWMVKDREVSAVLTGEGQVLRLSKKVISAYGGVQFVADNSLQGPSAGESVDETTWAAHLTVHAATLLPALSDDSRTARELLSEALPSLPEDLADRVRPFLDDGGPAQGFNGPNTAM